MKQSGLGWLHPSEAVKAPESNDQMRNRDMKNSHITALPSNPNYPQLGDDAEPRKHAKAQDYTKRFLKPEEKPALLPWKWATELEPNLDANDFVEGILANSGMSVVYGPSGSGKSFAVLDIAVAVASGKQWYGRECDKGVVIYLAAEGAEGVKNRIAALKKEGRLPEGTRLVYVACCINILDKKQVASLVATVESVRAGIDEPVRLIILDTLSRCMVGGNENAPEDMTAVVAASDRIREQTGAHVLFVHHSGKNAAAGARGHSSLRAATDAEIEIQREEGSEVGKIICRKVKDYEDFSPMAFRLKAVELGINSRGKSVTSCVLECVDAADVSQKQTSVDSAIGIILKALAESEDGLNTTEIWALEGAGKTPKAAALKTLTDSGAITMIRECRSNRYRLPQHRQPPQLDPKDYTSANPGRGLV